MTKRDDLSPPMASLQILRAAAALMVVFAHIYPQLQPYGIQGAVPNFIFGASGVDLFFVISGFVMVYASERLFGARGAPWRFFARRIVRIAPIYWLATAALLYESSDRLPSIGATWGNILGSLAFVPVLRPDGLTVPVLDVGWTLDHEMFFYVCFSFALLLSRRLAVAAITMAFVIALHYGDALIPVLPTAYRVWLSPFLNEFLFGAWIAAAYREGLRIPAWTSGLLIALGLGMMVYAHVGNFTGLSRTLGWGGGAAMIVAAMTLARVPALSSRLWRPLTVLGDASYALYLFHAVLPIYLANIVPHHFSPARHPGAFLVLLVGGSIVGALVIHFGLERPLTKFLQGKADELWSRKAVAIPTVREVAPISAV
jgi:exopolysaccharide production protein ExoZ